MPDLRPICGPLEGHNAVSLLKFAATTAFGTVPGTVSERERCDFGDERCADISAMASERTVSVRFEHFAQRMTAWSGHPLAFTLSVALVVAWAASGPFFSYSDTWQLFINTSTTVATFLMVFVIQHSQNKDSHAIQLKLNELLAATQGASSRLINVEALSDAELKRLHDFYDELVKLGRDSQTLLTSHTVEEARAIHEEKNEA